MAARNILALAAAASIMLGHSPASHISLAAGIGSARAERSKAKKRNTKETNKGKKKKNGKWGMVVKGAKGAAEVAARFGLGILNPALPAAVFPPRQRPAPKASRRQSKRKISGRKTPPAALGRRKSLTGFEGRRLTRAAQILLSIYDGG
jgi:hypothetical protein